MICLNYQSRYLARRNWLGFVWISCRSSLSLLPRASFSVVFFVDHFEPSNSAIFLPLLLLSCFFVMTRCGGSFGYPCLFVVEKDSRWAPVIVVPQASLATHHPSTP